jgi:glycosyltransferase involved in cell wall biosynthesis
MTTVAAIVTTYYRNEFLPQAIESLLDSEDVSIEIYVVDMSCERHAEQVVSEYDVNYVPILSYDTENTLEQIGRARDIGVSISDEDYVFFLDDDDTVSPDGISKLRGSLDGSCGVAFGIPDSLLSPHMIKQYYRADNPVDPDSIRSFMLGMLTTPLSTCAMLVERDVIERIPPIAELPHDDIATVFELTTETPIATVNETIVSSQQDDPDAGLSEESLRGQARMFSEYNEYYDTIPDELKLLDEQYEYAKSQHHRYNAMAALQNRTWSAEAIREYFNSARNNPNSTVYVYSRFLASLFGSHGISLFGKAQGKEIV